MTGFEKGSAEHEARRLAELKRLRVLDTAAEQSFDEITRRASKLCEVPIALISLIDEKRQWFKARVGLDPQETPREYAFCSHAMLETEPMVVENALLDARFSQNPLVTGEPGIRFYAGAPLVTLNGFELGTLCVIDRKPRRLSQIQLRELQHLSREVIYMLELRVPR